MPQTNNDQLIRDFHSKVNMSAGAIEAFLKTPESKKVGQRRGDNGESIGHKSGRAIAAILRKNKSQYTPADFDQMKRTVSYVARHTAQGGPKEDKEHSKWRYSLMNWGYDPLK
jgi:hypothetical protein